MRFHACAAELKIRVREKGYVMENAEKRRSLPFFLAIIMRFTNEIFCVLLLKKNLRFRYEFYAFCCIIFY
jgi:hypothetical protein